MSNLIPTIPTPTAVPWTPDMKSPDTQNSGTAQTFAAPQPQMHPAPYQPAPQYHAPQTEFAQPGPPQPPESYAPQPHMQPAPYAPAPQPQYASSPQHAPAIQPVHHMQQPAPPQMASVAAVPSQMAPQTHMAQPQQYAPPQQPLYAQAGPPPPLHFGMPPQMQSAAMDLLPQTPPQPPETSNGFIANLLKRSPKPARAGTDFDQAAGSSSLFNKNFILGAVTGLVVGAFVLPMVLNVFGGSESAQVQAQALTPASFGSVPDASDGGTFIDNAIATDAP